MFETGITIVSCGVALYVAAFLVFPLLRPARSSLRCAAWGVCLDIGVAVVFTGMGVSAAGTL